MEKNASKAVKSMSKTDILLLKGHLLSKCHMHSEFSFINIDANDPECEIVDRLWNILIFRPDVASKVEHLCRGGDGGDIKLPTFANLLQKAIDAGDWPQDLW